jgi:hypothetical protein
MKDKIKILNEPNLYRDPTSNALIFSEFKETSYEKRRSFMEQQQNEINSMKQEISEIKNTMSKILNILEK